MVRAARVGFVSTSAALSTETGAFWPGERPCCKRGRSLPAGAGFKQPNACRAHQVAHR